jgi:hypothetical protein
MTTSVQIYQGLQLKACPFCGGAPELKRAPGEKQLGYLIQCDHPDCTVVVVAGPCATEAEVAGQWNQRV